MNKWKALFLDPDKLIPGVIIIGVVIAVMLGHGDKVQKATEGVKAGKELSAEISGVLPAAPSGATVEAVDQND